MTHVFDCDAGKTALTSPDIQRFERRATDHGPGRLDADQLMELALRRAGRRDFSDHSFIEPFKRLLKAYEQEADLSRFGLRAVKFDMLRCLANLLRLDQAEEADPGIVARQIQAPIFITGLPRSATTFLHTLIAQDPAFAAPRCWQSIYPYPAHVMGVNLRRIEVEFQFAMFRFLSPGVSALHPLAADTPQECTDITAQVFQSLRFDTTHRIPSYQSWLDDHGHCDAFRFHRRFLQHLDAQAPGHRWVLKSPDNVFALDAIREAYPDARIVFLHRDPLSVVASCVKLAELLRRPFTNHIDRDELGDQVSSRLVESTTEMAEAAERDPGILHLHYRAVVAKPMETVRALYEHCGMTLSGEAEARMRHWLRTPRKHRHARYSLEEFGLNARDLRRRFARYMQDFNVTPEASAVRMH